MNPGHSDEARRREAEAILRRVRQETEPQVGAGARLARVGDHFRAADVEGGDRIEVLGTRIARVAAALVLVVLAVSLLAALF